MDQTVFKALQVSKYGKWTDGWKSEPGLKQNSRRAWPRSELEGDVGLHLTVSITWNSTIINFIICTCAFPIVTHQKWPIQSVLVQLVILGLVKCQSGIKRKLLKTDRAHKLPSGTPPNSLLLTVCTHKFF